MASPPEGGRARSFHEATKHSPASVRQGMRRLDWANKPRPFKEYRDRPMVPLPAEVPRPQRDTLEAIATTAEDGGDLDLPTLASLLYHAAGITKRMPTPTGEWYFRAAACAGALYPIELYVVTATLPDLPAGVYHFAPKEFGLVPLREDDVRPPLAAAMGEERVESPAYLVLSAIFWRSAWKYGARSYRYCFWDSGTILANLLATATSLDLPGRVVLGFVDEEVNRLLGLDGEEEAALAVVPVGRTAGPRARREDLPPLEAETAPLSAEKVTYPALHEVHRASVLRTPEEAEAWKGTLRRTPSPPEGTAIPLADGVTAGRPLGPVIRQRGSTRRFRTAPVGRDQLAAVLRSATRVLPTDFRTGPENTLQDIYLLVHAVEGLAAGAYHYEPVAHRLDLLKEGSFRPKGGFLALEQELAATASVDVFFLTDLDRVLDRYGDRGYRAVQLEAGILGGRMYLAAYALGLGATGLTFYDDEIVGFFAPHAAGREPVFLVALGRPGKVPSRVEAVPGPAALRA